MENARSNTARACFWCTGTVSVAALGVRLLLFAGALLCVAALSSCAPVASLTPVARSHDFEQAGDSALPPLDGEYSYALVEVLSKDAESDSIEVEVVAWDDARTFNKSGLAAGATGDVSCSELVFFPAGIGDGSTVVVCCGSSEDDAFPLTAYAIEKLALFEERVDRWESA